MRARKRQPPYEDALTRADRACARGLITVREKQSLRDLYLFWRWRGIRRDSLYVGGVH